MKNIIVVNDDDFGVITAIQKELGVTQQKAASYLMEVGLINMLSFPNRFSADKLNVLTTGNWPKLLEKLKEVWKMDIPGFGVYFEVNQDELQALASLAVGLFVQSKINKTNCLESVAKKIMDVCKQLSPELAKFINEELLPSCEAVLTNNIDKMNNTIGSVQDELNQTVEALQSAGSQAKDIAGDKS